MLLENLCSPALLYLAFALTQIAIDIFKQMYNTAIMKVAVAIVFTTLLNILCTRGLTVISWFIVFIPFITMTLVTGILLYVFGLAPFTGKLDYQIQQSTQQANPAVSRQPKIMPEPASLNEGGTLRQSMMPNSQHIDTIPSNAHDQIDQNGQPTKMAQITETSVIEYTEPVAAYSENNSPSGIKGVVHGVGKVASGVVGGVADVGKGIGKGIQSVGSGIASAL